jgi:hypothetical protein
VAEVTDKLTLPALISLEAMSRLIARTCEWGEVVAKGGDSFSIPISVENEWPEIRVVALLAKWLPEEVPLYGFARRFDVGHQRPTSDLAAVAAE